MNTHRIVVFTGAAGNMGTMFVERSLANGDRVRAIGNDEEALGRLAGAQPNLHVLTDVSNEGNCAEFANFVLDKAGRVDVVINSAGFFPIMPTPYIANPDLVARLRAGAPLKKPNPPTFYGEGAKGYTDYPARPLVNAAA